MNTTRCVLATALSLVLLAPGLSMAGVAGAPPALGAQEGTRVPTLAATLGLHGVYLLQDDPAFARGTVVVLGADAGASYALESAAGASVATARSDGALLFYDVARPLRLAKVDGSPLPFLPRPDEATLMAEGAACNAWSQTVSYQYGSITGFLEEVCGSFAVDGGYDLFANPTVNSFQFQGATGDVRWWNRAHFEQYQYSHSFHNSGVQGIRFFADCGVSQYSVVVTSMYAHSSTGAPGVTYMSVDNGGFVTTSACLPASI